MTLLCGGWPGAAHRVVLDGIDVHRVGTRYTFPALARRYYRTHLAPAGWDVLVEDINKVPLGTPRWGAPRQATPHWRAPRSVALVPHLFGSTVFQEAALPLAGIVWLAERPLPHLYRGVPFQAISESTADDLAARGVPRESIEVIYPGIDTAHFTPDRAGRSPTPLFTYLGRLKRYKGVDLILRAFARLGHLGATLEIAGTGDFRPELERLAVSLDLGDRVRFLGFVSEAEKLRLLRRSWALCFTSPKEGWGITNLEAAACGTPVIASRSPGLRESVVDGSTGFLVPHGDIPRLTSAMARMAASRELVESLGTAGREFAESFTWDRAATETARHLSLVAGHGG